MKHFALIAFEGNRCRSKVVCVTKAENDDEAARKFGCEKVDVSLMKPDKDAPSRDLLIGVCNYLMTNDEGYRGMVVRMSMHEEGRVQRSLDLARRSGSKPEWIAETIAWAEVLMVAEVPYLE